MRGLLIVCLTISPGHADYLLVVVVAVVLSGANVVGYTKCSKQASAQLKSYATQAVTSGLTVRASPSQGFMTWQHVQKVGKCQ